MTLTRSLQTIYHATRKSELDKARYFIDLALSESSEAPGDTVEDLSGLIADLAQAFRREDRVDDAIGEMRRSLALKENPANRAILDFWSPFPLEMSPAASCPSCRQEILTPVPESCPSCRRFVLKCQACGHANRALDSFCRRCGARRPTSPPEQILVGSLTPSWFFPFQNPTTIMSAPPVIMGDMVLVALPASGELIALKLASGALVWQEKDLFSGMHPPRLTVAYPFTYIFADRVVLRLMDVGDNVELETVYTNDEFQPESPLAAVLENGTESAVFFACGQRLFVHHLLRRHPTTVSTDLEVGDGLHSPVVTSNRVYVLSKKGRLLSYVPNRDPAFDTLLQVPDCTVCGPPECFRDRIVFEALHGDARILHLWDPAKPLRPVQSVELPDAGCSLEDAHFLRAPFICHEGAIVVADEPAALHFIRLTSDAPDTCRKQVDLSTGPIRVSNIEAQLSTVCDPYFISWIPSGFFWMHVEDPSMGGIEFFGSEMIAAPLCSGARLILTCQDGVRCYVF